ncbi:hypothetical protein IT6_06970 [Methylacidiphilum caldifontis]|uniref:hypothetical protein n=1 Tax=Methylacidiphilum caldifontis TaxID=2795386 RepID=UPI001A8DF891|nr:hypothetical protein [Methylacidiphilum caldifontis]QSR88125.1 hypothetical protein IT6_06970 [Methylacidiphilum caldifontis]
MGLDIIHKYGTTISAMAAFPVIAINGSLDQRCNERQGGDSIWLKIEFLMSCCVMNKKMSKNQSNRVEFGTEEKK